MNKPFRIFLSAGFVLIAALCGEIFAEDPMTQQELVRRSEALLNGVAAGDNSAWKEYFADDGLFFDEKGRSMDKARLVEEIAALPEGYKLVFKVENPKSLIFEGTAILSYDIDEDLKIYGQQVGARFHTTDSWMRRNGKWQIVASQSFRYYGDPALGRVDRNKFPEFTGEYELAPGVHAKIFVEGEDLYYQREGRPREQLFAEAPDVFFRKDVEGRMLFRYDNNGKVDALISRRNHEDLVWTKVK